MIQKRPILVVTFFTTAAAISFEKACGAAGIPGRLFPAPRDLTSDCGIAWQSPPSYEDAIRRLLSENSAEHDRVTLLEV